MQPEFPTVIYKEIDPYCVKLSSHQLDDAIPELLFHVYSIYSIRHLFINKPLCVWTIDELVTLLRSFDVLKNKEAFCSIIDNECIDGEVFSMLLFSGEIANSIRAGSTDIFQSITTDEYIILRVFFQAIDNTSLDYRSSLELTLSDCYKIAIQMNYFSDLSNYPADMVEELLTTNQQCNLDGTGSIYGQLTVLGYKEYRHIEDKWTPFGLPNITFPLLRRKLPNASTIHSNDTHTSPNQGIVRLQYPKSLLTNSQRQAVTLNYPDQDTFSDHITIAEYHSTVNPFRDCYQIGRAMHSTNDLVIPGPIVNGIDGQTHSPVSRWSCRIECERVAPFRCFLYAAGYDTNKTLNADAINISDDTGGTLVDGITTLGVRLYQPETQEWQEISILGKNYKYIATNTDHVSSTSVSRSHSFYHVRSTSSSLQGHTQQINEDIDDAVTTNSILANRSQRLLTPVTNNSLGNQLTDRSLIDIGGVILLFRDPVGLACAQRKQVDSNLIIQSFNQRRPQCAVLFTDILFRHHTASERARHVIERACVDGQFHPIVGPFTVPNTIDIELPAGSASNTPTMINNRREERCFVFPACGHVYGYNIELENRPCPMCRTIGAYVPVAFAFDKEVITCCSLPTTTTTTMDIDASDLSKMAEFVPTHVFNPCGHIASLAVCEYWSRLPVFSRNITSINSTIASNMVHPHHTNANTFNNSNSMHVLEPCCPFCATPLQLSSTQSTYYSKLNFHAAIEADDDGQYTQSCKSNKEPQVPFAQEQSTLSIIQAQRELFERANGDIHHNTRKGRVCYPVFAPQLPPMHQYA